MTPETETIADLDAGQSFGTETYGFLRPFRFKGVEHRSVAVRVPSGADVDGFIGAGRSDTAGLMSHLTGLPKDLFDRIYGGDRDGLDRAIGRHLAPPPATAPGPFSQIVVDLDAGEGFGEETYGLVKPFRLAGAVYREIRIRVPNGWDVEKNVSPATGRIDVPAMREHLTEKRPAIFAAMYAADRAGVDRILGKHSGTSR